MYNFRLMKTTIAMFTIGTFTLSGQEVRSQDVLTVGETYSQNFDSMGWRGAEGSLFPSSWSATNGVGSQAWHQTHAPFPPSRYDLSSSNIHTLNVGEDYTSGSWDRSLAVYHNSNDTTALQFNTETNSDADTLQLGFSIEAWGFVGRDRTDMGEAAFDVSVEIRDAGSTDLDSVFTELIDLGTITTGAVLQPPTGDYVLGNVANNRFVFSSDVLEAEIPAGSELRFRWETVEDSDAGEEWIFGIDDVNITLGANASAAAAVPEPTGLSIALFGLLGLIGFRKRR